MKTRTSDAGLLAKGCDPMTTSSIPRTSGIYKITCIANSKIYIGSSLNLGRRWKMHVRLLKRKVHSNPHLQNAWNKYGEQTFVFEVIELVVPLSIIDREQYWLDLFKPYDRLIGFNIAKNAESPNLGIPMTESAKKKLSVINTGKTISQEIRSKISEALKGRIVSSETRRLISEKKKGHTHGFKSGVKKTAEERAYMSKYLTGLKKNITPEHREKIVESSRKNYIVTTPDGEEMSVRGMRRFCKEHGLTATSMSAVANGKYASHKGWKCRHA